MMKIGLNLRNAMTIVICFTVTMLISCNSKSKQEQKTVSHILPETKISEAIAEEPEAKTDTSEIESLADDFTEIFEAIAKGSKAKTETFEILGTWADDFTAGLLWRIIKKENGSYILEMGTPWRSHRRLRKTKRNGKEIYIDTESLNEEEYYRIEPNGNLAVFDNHGYIATYKKIK